jgi:hypothetical protein
MRECGPGLRAHERGEGEKRECNCESPTSVRRVEGTSAKRAYFFTESGRDSKGSGDRASFVGLSLVEKIAERY